MTDAEYEAAKARIEPILDRWLTWMGLKYWDIDVDWDREGFRSDYTQDAEALCAAKVTVRWQYLYTNIRLNVPVLGDMTDDRIERTIVHELSHILVAEIQTESNAEIDHVERVVSSLTKAFRWVKQLAGKEATSGQDAEQTPRGNGVAQDEGRRDDDGEGQGAGAAEEGRQGREEVLTA